MTEKFKNTIGHEKQKLYFSSAIEKNRLSHAYVFAGPEGIGKTTFAMELAQAVGSHPVLDVFSYDEGEFSVEQARELKNNMRLRSTGGKYKVGIITKADTMTHSASNSILKLLEEPTKNSLLILTCRNFHYLLPTIVSRVQRITFSTLTEKEMRRITDQRQVLDLAEGRPGLALRLTESKELLNFYVQAKRTFEILESGDLSSRMTQAQELSKSKPEELADFINFAMEQWITKSRDYKLGKSIFKSFNDLNSNLNQKLLLDNLFVR